MLLRFVFILQNGVLVPMKMDGFERILSFLISRHDDFASAPVRIWP